LAQPPGVMMVAVKSGALTIYDTNCSKTTVTAGNAFVMMGPMHVRLVRNEGDVPVEISGHTCSPGTRPPATARPACAGAVRRPRLVTRLPHRRKIDPGIAGALQLRYIQ